MASAARGPVPRVQFVERKRAVLSPGSGSNPVVGWQADAQKTQPNFCLASRSKHADGDIISKPDVLRGGQSGDGWMVTATAFPIHLLITNGLPQCTHALPSAGHQGKCSLLRGLIDFNVFVNGKQQPSIAIITTYNSFKICSIILMVPFFHKHSWSSSCPTFSIAKD